MLSLLTVAALTPEEHSVRILDEQLEDIPATVEADVIGITVMTATAPRAYELCLRFKQQGIPVVLGGFHPTFNVDEAGKYADAVVIGPAYDAWQAVLRDVQAGALQKQYLGNPAGIVPTTLPKHLLNASKYVSVHTTYATLGCRNDCHFCSIKSFYQGQRYVRKIDDIVQELRSFQSRFVMFVDDNLTQDREYVKALLTAMQPLKKTWITQASIDIADDADLLALMRDSGCVGVFIGLETFSLQALSSQGKVLKSPQFYQEAVQKLHQHGIFVEAGIIFGFDVDEPTVFKRTLQTLDRIGIDAIQVSVLTPLPGTQLFESLKARIFDTNWEHYDYKHVVFHPTHMLPEELDAGNQWVIRKYYAPLRILKRVSRWLRTPNGLRHLIYPLGLNLAYLGRVLRFHIRGYNPAAPKVRQAKTWRQKKQSIYAPSPTTR
ncbi:MAG: radical SAM protein, partial [Smithellaceae bacterium]